MKTNQKIAVAAALTLTLVAAGCGDGGSVGTITAVPDSAGISAQSFIDFIRSLNPNDETSEPLTISDNFAVPPDDTNEPQVI